MADNYRVVDEFTITIRAVITEYDREDGTHVYDWRTQNDDSDEWYYSAAEAREAAQNHYD